MFRLSLAAIFLVILTGCSFQASYPAPVESLSFEYRPAYIKGSLRGNKYQVQDGDTLYSIAWGADKDFQELAQLNGLNEPYTIYPGEELRLSAPKPVYQPYTPAVYPVVKPQITQEKPKTSYKAKTNTYDGDLVKTSSPNEKNLANKKQQAYPVTSAQQSVNRPIKTTANIAKPKTASPKLYPAKVSNWIWPVNGKLIGTFSASEQGNKGIKIAGKKGEVIKSAAAGRVVYAGNALRGYGNLIIIKHNNDYLSAYAHTDKILVKEKQHVNAGQAVATMGKTEAHQVMLHFEIRYHGQSVNPLKFLPKR